jgi:tRNA(Ile)-lysidine synthase
LSEFGPEWLHARLLALIPDYPRVAVCVALSGGLDSAALLTALVQTTALVQRTSSVQGRPLTQGRGSQPALRAIHVDHGLHPNSTEWAEHCRQLSKSLDVPLTVLKTRVERRRGESLEAAAREARYELLADALSDGEFLLTAHHEDDQLETVLLQLFRGTGLAGLAAMPVLTRFARGWLARPLLQVQRAQLEAWARANELRWVEDSSNADVRFDRNYLRARVLPLVRARWPAASRAVSRSASHAAEGQRLLNSIALRDIEQAAVGPALSVRKLRTLDRDRLRNALRFWIDRAGLPAPDRRRLDELSGPVLRARPDANPQVAWGDVIVQRQGDLLTIREQAAPPRLEPQLWAWLSRPALELPAPLGTLELLHDPHGPLNVGALPPEVMVRWRVGGERLKPRPGGPSRAVKSLLQEARIPPAQRGSVPLLFHSEKLLAVGDQWFDASIQAVAEGQSRARLIWRRPVI